MSSFCCTVPTDGLRDLSRDCVDAIVSAISLVGVIRLALLRIALRDLKRDTACTETSQKVGQRAYTHGPAAGSRRLIH